MSGFRWRCLVDSPRRRAAIERGAAAVEFALVSLILLPIVVGVIAYGLWFNDSLNVRQGVREGARAGVVKNFSSTGCTGNDMAILACKTKRQIGAITGEAYVKISAPQGWQKAKPLVVCAMVPASAVALMPLPNDGVITSRTEMSIEITDSLPNALSYTDPAPAGTSWSWCV
jgi:Flp pilus assembly protein TadG